jgi:5-hydroxyisourate hydrolase
MPGVSIHVVDVARGVVASGMRVEFLACAPPRTIGDGRVATNGSLDVPALAARLDAGRYEARFHVAEYFRTAGVALPQVPFLDVVSFAFGIDDPQQHYHLPMKLTPWGLSCFRGGA